MTEDDISDLNALIMRKSECEKGLINAQSSLRIADNALEQWLFAHTDKKVEVVKNN